MLGTDKLDLEREIYRLYSILEILSNIFLLQGVFPIGSNEPLRQRGTERKKYKKSLCLWGEVQAILNQHKNAQECVATTIITH